MLQYMFNAVGKPQSPLDLIQVGLMKWAYFGKHFAALLGPGKDEFAEVHNLLNLTVVNNKSLPPLRFAEFDITFMGLLEPKVGFLTARNQTENNFVKPKSIPGYVAF